MPRRSTSLCQVSSGLPGLAGSDPDLAAVEQIDGGIEDHLVTIFDAGVHFETRAEVAHRGYRTDSRDAVFDHGDAETPAVENDRLGGDDQRRGLARNLQLDGAVSSRRQFVARIGYVDLGQQSSRARL